MTSAPTFKGWRRDSALSALFISVALLFSPLAQSPAQPARPASPSARMRENTPLLRIGIAPIARWSIHDAAYDFTSTPKLGEIKTQGPARARAGLALFAESPLPICSDLFLTARLSYLSDRVELASTTRSFEIRPDPDHPDSTIVLTTQGRLLASISALTFAPGIAWAPVPALRIGLAPTLRFQLGSTQEAREVIVSPTGAIFTKDSSAERPIDGAPTLPFRSVVPGLDLWAGASLRLARDLRLEPSVRASVSLAPLLTDAPWRNYGLEGSVGLSYAFGTASPPADTPVWTHGQERPPVARVDTPAASPRKSRLYATLIARGVDANGNEYDNPIIEIEEAPWTVTVPMIPAIFLDSAAGDIPARYARPHTVEEARRFNVDSLTSISPLDIHRQLLNIVGARLRDDPTKRLRVTAVDADQGDGDVRAALDLSLQAVLGVVVGKYLPPFLSGQVGDSTSVRSEGRVTAEMHTERGHVSEAERRMQATRAWRDENRRLDLALNDEDLAEPIVIHKMATVASPPMVRFAPRIFADTTVAEWYVSVTQGAKELLRFEGDGRDTSLRQTKQWSLGDMRVNRDTTPVKYRLFVRDVLGQTFSIDGTFRVLDRVRRKPGEPAPGQVEVREFYLVGFDYSSAELKPVHLAQLRRVAAQISDNAEVSITGYTDRLGDSVRNRQLSVDRARAVLAALRAAKVTGGGSMPTLLTVQGRGPDQVPFDNSDPEGRIFSRMVHIIVRQAVRR